MMDYIESSRLFFNNDPGVLLAMVLGSIADNRRRRNDEFSDVDLFLVVDNPEVYLKDPQWLSYYDEVSMFFNDPISLGTGMELRVAFADGLLSDIAIVSPSEFAQLLCNPVFCDKIIGRGQIILDNKMSFLTAPTYNMIPSLNSEILERKADEFWIDVACILKYISRDDFFSAKYAFDRRIIKLLLWILENNTQCHIQRDTMFNGRQLRSWLCKKYADNIEKINFAENENAFIDNLMIAIQIFEENYGALADRLGSITEVRNSLVSSIKAQISAEQLRRRIVSEIKAYCFGENWETVKPIINAKVREMIRLQSPICFVLPGFPGKSPNIFSTFTAKPGYEEYCAVESIRKLIDRITGIYPIGCEFHIIHDGHIFLDLGITRSESELDNYVSLFREMYVDVDKSIFSHVLSDLIPGTCSNTSLELFVQNYVDYSETIDAKEYRNEILFTRHEFSAPFLNLATNNSIQRKAKLIAKEVLYRKYGISKLICDKFSSCIRLSVHYQAPNSEKLGFRLIEQALNTGTPWFNVVYQSPSGRRIMGKLDWTVSGKEEQISLAGKYYAISEKELNILATSFGRDNHGIYIR